VIRERRGLAGEEHDARVHGLDADVAVLERGVLGQGALDPLLELRVGGRDRFLEIFGHHLEDASHVPDAVDGPGHPLRLRLGRFAPDVTGG
jgi:hypothetical protein